MIQLIKAKALNWTGHNKLSKQRANNKTEIAC